MFTEDGRGSTVVRMVERIHASLIIPVSRPKNGRVRNSRYMDSLGEQLTRTLPKQQHHQATTTVDKRTCMEVALRHYLLALCQAVNKASLDRNSYCTCAGPPR